jgi:biotin operon repressor
MEQQFTFSGDPVGALETIISSVLANPRLEPKARELLQVLRYHKGPQNPCSGQKLSEQLKVDERGVKQYARTLCMDWGIPVGANRQPPYGYYLCVTAEDRMRASRHFVHQAVAELARARAYQPERTMLELLGQAELEKGTA